MKIMFEKHTYCDIYIITVILLIITQACIRLLLTMLIYQITRNKVHRVHFMIRNARTRDAFRRETIRIKIGNFLTYTYT